MPDSLDIEWSSEMLESGGDVVLISRSLTQSFRCPMTDVEAQQQFSLFEKRRSQLLSILAAASVPMLLVALFAATVLKHVHGKNLLLRDVLFNDMNGTWLQAFPESLSNAAMLVFGVFVLTAFYLLLLTKVSSSLAFSYLCVVYFSLATSSFAVHVRLLITLCSMPVDFLSLTLLSGSTGACICIGIFLAPPTHPLHRASLLLFASLVALPFVSLSARSLWCSMALFVVYDTFSVLAPCGILRRALDTSEPLHSGLVFDANSLLLGLGDLIVFAVVCGSASKRSAQASLSAFISLLSGLLFTLGMNFSKRSRLRSLPALPLSLLFHALVAISHHLITNDFLKHIVAPLQA